MRSPMTTRCGRVNLLAALAPLEATTSAARADLSASGWPLGLAHVRSMRSESNRSSARASMAARARALEDPPLTAETTRRRGRERLPELDDEHHEEDRAHGQGPQSLSAAV
jgi:hypothetical protein